MATLVLTAIGEDRAGLVHSVAEVVAAHGGNWERAEMAELAGQFAGIVMVTIPDPAASPLIAALTPLAGLSINVRAGNGGFESPERTITVDLLGDDRPGIINEVTAILRRHGANIVRLRSETREAPMTGGQLFAVNATVSLGANADVGALQTDLESLAQELMVDIDFGL